MALIKLVGKVSRFVENAKLFSYVTFVFYGILMTVS